MTFPKILFFIFIFSFSTVKADEAASAGTVMCNYLVNLANKSKLNADIGFLADIGNKITELNGLKNMAINSKYTFEQYKALVLERTHTKVPDSFKTFYLQSYANRYCGPVQTEAGVSEPEKSRSISSNQLKSFTKDPAVDGHAYYQEAKTSK